MNWIKKLVPAFIEVRSLYWVQKHREMTKELEAIFLAIDMDLYDRASDLVETFEEKWSAIKTPEWMRNTRAQLSSATTMLYFLHGITEEK
jgi:hypothetical protein